jgi:SAM-dependent methyltransferase
MRPKDDSLMSEAERWERGSREDESRNKFVIPQVARIFDSEQPPTILDVGAGTGYVARTVDTKLSYRPTWTLIDLSQSRLKLAQTLKPETMVLNPVVGNVFDWPLPGNRFDAVLISFTLLEINDVDRLLSLISGKTGGGALLVIVLPDSWVDILERARVDPSVVQRYIAGSVEIPKLDKFTNREYPFHALRSESVIATALRNGFDLFDLEHGMVGAASAFVLAFRRRTRVCE